MKTAIRLQDMAQSLNLSISTVSKSLSNSSEISARTKKRVRELAELKQYLPNSSAQNLKGQKSRNIGVILPNICERFYSEALNAMEAKLNERDYRIILCISNESREKEINSIHKLLQAQVDGIIISPSIETFERKKIEHLAKIQQYNIPLLIFDRLVKNIKCDKVSVDQNLMVEEGTNKLFNIGYRKICFLSKKLDEGKLNYRRKGYYDAIKNNALPNLFLEFDEEELLLNEVMKLINTKEIDALIVPDDALVRRIAQVMNDKNFTNSEIGLLCLSKGGSLEFKVPGINYIYQNGREQGEISADTVVDRIENLLSPDPLEFILRASTNHLDLPIKKVS